MEKIKNVVNQSWFKAACCGAISAALFFNGSINYAFFAAGFGIREFFLAFKQSKKINKLKGYLYKLQLAFFIKERKYAKDKNKESIYGSSLSVR